MIFKPELITEIRAGRKTQTRRPVKAGEKTCRYTPGHVYSVQPGRGMRGEVQITVLAVRQERVGDISAGDARREGFGHVRAFLAYWRDLYGEDADLQQSVWVISFALGDRRDIPRLLRAGAPKWDPRSEHRVERDEDHGYTSRPALALAAEPEAIDNETLEAYAAVNRAKPRITEQQVWERERATIREAIQRLRNQELRKDVEGELGLLEARLAKIDRRLSMAAVSS